MFQLYASTTGGAEILISNNVKRSDLIAAINQIIQQGLNPFPKRINRTPREIIRDVFASYK